jgi:hypothetical protein
LLKTFRKHTEQEVRARHFIAYLADKKKKQEKNWEGEELGRRRTGKEKNWK